MFRSIRWTLQLWHAAILAAALLCFGAVLYHHERQAMLQRVDAELEGAARVLAHGPMGPPPRWFNQGSDAPRPDPSNPNAPRPDTRAAPTEQQASVSDAPPEPGPGSPPDEHSRGPGMLPHDGESTSQTAEGMHGPRGRMPMRDWWAHVPQDVLRRLGQDPSNQPYFAVWESDATLLRSSTPGSLPALTMPAAFARGAPDGPEAPSVFRQVGPRREVIVPGPHGSTVLVGISIAPEQAALLRLRWIIILSGAGVLLVGLAGGWVLSQRAIRPIAQISHIAQSISGSDLSQRIAVGDTHSELGSLAATLNATFDRLQKAFERQVRFTADASHELRTPLSVIQSHGELALARERSADEYRQTIQTCLRSARRMRSLVDSLLALARSDAGQLDLRLERFDLREAAEECLLMVAPQAQEHGVKVESQIPGIFIEADRMRISQLLINLLSNAVRYNREGGVARLTITPGKTDVTIEVADTGVGIADDDQPHVFERFFRSDKARSREVGGSGLGLAICQGIVEAHRGNIRFTSEAGRGSVFSVKLPVEQFAQDMNPLTRPGAATQQEPRTKRYSAQ